MKKLTFEASHGILDYAAEKGIMELGINACRDKFERDRLYAMELAHAHIKSICEISNIPTDDRYHVIKLTFVEWDSSKWHGSGYWEVTISGKEEFIDNLEKALNA